MKRNHRDDSVFSRKIRAGQKRTYFIDVRQTRGNDYFITLTESTRKFHGERVERQRIFLYREDFNRFLEGLEECINHVKNNLMPNYDYEKFDRRQDDWEYNREEKRNIPPPQENEVGNDNESSTEETQEPEEDDLSW